MAETVYVLYRSSLHHCLILGVFSSGASAREYVERMQIASADAWRAGRPGSGRWDLLTRDYHYTIEAHPVRHGAEPRGHDVLKEERYMSQDDPDKPREAQDC